MGGKIPFILMAVALVVIGGGIAMMGRMGDTSATDVSTDPADSSEAQARGKYADDPLTPTPTFNVSEKLDSGVNLITEVSSIADQLHAPESDPVDDLHAVGEIIQFHSRMFKSVPGGGENVDIMRKLTGGNEKKLALIDPEHPAINEQGELVDRWGTPFHFHQISARELEVRSAGPDKALYTEDDVLIEGDQEEAVSEES